MTNISFKPFPILTTERLTLRQLSIDDQQNIFELRSDKKINKYLDRPISTTIDDARNFINKVIENNALYWAITLTKTRTFVGTICLFDFSNEKSSCEIGYELMTKFQGRGIMKEAAEKVIDYAFNTIKIQKIEAIFHRDNQRSVNLLEKLMFRNSNEPDKTAPELIYYCLTNPFDNFKKNSTGKAN